MTRLLLNGEDHVIEIGPEYWGDLLTQIERAAQGRGEVVTAVRLDGVEEPTFRDPAQRHRHLRNFHEIEISTATPQGLVDQALAHAAAGAEALASAALDTARAFRGADAQQASDRVTELGHGMGSLFSLFGKLSEVRVSAHDQIDDPNNALPARLNALVGHYETLVKAQQSRNWLAAADALEHNIQPLLRSCGAAFAAMRLDHRAPDQPAVREARFSAVCCVYDDDSWLALAIESVYDACDSILFLVSETPWNGETSDQAALVERIRALPDPQGKIRVERGRWPDEASQRNEGLRLVAEAGVEYCFVLDADEIYDTAQLQAAMAIVRQNPQIDCWRLSCLTYWKSCRYRVDPPEVLAAPVFVRSGSGHFVENRNYEAPRQVRLAPETIVFHHMSYARTDEQILRKIKTWGHARDVVPGWYENVWRKWDEDHSLKNLNPCWPSAYQGIVEQPSHALPPVVQRLLSGCSVRL